MAVLTTLNKEQIVQQLQDCSSEIKTFGVSRLGLFGSIVRGEENKESDIDILVEFNKDKKTYDNFIKLAFFLEDMFHKRVDLMTRKSLSDRLKKYIDKEIVYVTFTS